MVGRARFLPIIEMHYLITFLLCVIVCDADIVDYRNRRAEILKQESVMTLGGNATLTDKEDAVNTCLMTYKFREVEFGFDNPQYFNFSRHYFFYKDFIRSSRVYQIIKDMPKGAALHVHDMGILGPDYLINVTYFDPNLYICNETENVKLLFSAKVPNNECNTEWNLLSKIRRQQNEAEFNAELRKHFTLVVDDPDRVYPSIKETWSTFMKYFGTVAPLLSYRPVWENYFFDALLKFREHNIMYVEVRSVLPNLYELDGTVYTPLITAKAYRKAIRRFVKTYPDFLGAKLIYAPPRNVGPAIIADYITLAKAIKKDMPEHFAGFDIVGQEDLGSPLIEFVPQFEAASKDLDYFFHAGETDWYGTSTDENLIDAILLGAKRLGHAYALLKHPVLLKEVKDKGIGLEVNVISNNVLSLVKDIRNHPLSAFFADGLPVVLSSDDPGAWEADPISGDFYVAFVGVASKHSDLKLLKTLSINSIKYSALSKEVKADALVKFNLQWNKFIDNFNCSSYQ